MGGDSPRPGARTHPSAKSPWAETLIALSVRLRAGGSCHRQSPARVNGLPARERAAEPRQGFPIAPMPIERSDLWAPMAGGSRSEEHTSELQSLMRISYAVFCLKQKKVQISHKTDTVQNI